MYANHYSIDKPTKDELVELLSSSKFTAGTWEQFVCCLPNMTPDIIGNIKQRVKEFSATQPDLIDYVSAVAQYCLDNNPDITWKSIIHTLLATDEVVIAHQILEEKIIKSVTGASKTVARVLRNHYSRLFYATESNLRAIARELYSKGVISRAVRKKPTLGKIEVEFLAIVEMHKKDQSMLRQHCMVFLQCIASVKGPALEEAFALARDWDIELLERNEISFSIHQSLKTTSKFDIIFSINSRSEDIIATELDRLSDEFASLLTEIKEFYDTDKKHEIINIARWVEERFDGVDFLALNNTRIDDIFRKLKEKSYYNLLDIQSIRRILEKFPINSQLQTRFEDYVDDVRRFIVSTNVSDLKNEFSAAFERKESDFCNNRVILKLSQKWSEQSINNLRKLMQYFFGEKADSLTYDNSFEGSIIIQFVIFSEKDAHPLVQMAYSQAVFMHHFGVLQLIIDNKTIIDKFEDANFEFEQSLNDAISNFHNDMEYHKIVLFLLQLEININYQSEHGSTALMSASVNGHHQVVELLLSKDPVINIQNNEGWTALMYASNNGHHQVVELLLSKNPDINIQNNEGWTALMYASNNGHHQVVELLLRNYVESNGGYDSLSKVRSASPTVATTYVSTDGPEPRGSESAFLDNRVVGAVGRYGGGGGRPGDKLMSLVMSKITGIQLAELTKDSQIHTLQDKIAQLETKLSMNEELLSFMENSNFDMVWKIPQFSQCMDDARTGKYTSISSLPFYSSRYGYKMCLRLYILGDGIGKGTHMSLFFVVMKGEHDAILQWPFTHKVTFKLINQCGGRDVVDVLQPDPLSPSFQKPKSDMNVASGFPCFVSMNELMQGGFILDDTIFIKAKVDIPTMRLTV